MASHLGPQIADAIGRAGHHRFEWLIPIGASLAWMQEIGGSAFSRPVWVEGG
jgi:hypothetical protein